MFSMVVSNMNSNTDSFLLFKGELAGLGTLSVSAMKRGRGEVSEKRETKSFQATQKYSHFPILPPYGTYR